MPTVVCVCKTNFVINFATSIIFKHSLKEECLEFSISRSIAVACLDRERVRDGRCICMCARPALTAGQCQGREGVAEIVAWNYDAYTPNFPSLSEVRASDYATGSFPSFYPRRVRRRVPSLRVHPYLAAFSREPDATPRASVCLYLPLRRCASCHPFSSSQIDHVK
ncbi:hypothetical protein PUN28_002392 [Cardiocondyla obscurior]|uniref:Uncharacterized protein n=1 Tax=Cardiocondyla obscurior TaxID=286306 RepID=A0AAW2GTX0_9HYME